MIVMMTIFSLIIIYLSIIRIIHIKNKVFIKMKSIIYWSALLSSALFMTQCANSKKITQKNDIPKERNLAYQDIEY